MRLIFNVPDLLSGKGGAERVAVELANRLVSLGHSVALLCTERDKPPSYDVDAAVSIITTHSMYSPGGQKLAVERCLQFEPTAYFFFYSNGHIVDQYAIGKRLGVPMGAQECTNPVRCIRNIASELKLTVEEAGMLRTAILADMAAIRMTMEHYMDSLPAFVRERVFCFKNSFPNIGPVEPAVSGGRQWILNVSGLGKKNKNGLALIKALPHVVAKHPGWGALFVGSTSNQRRATELANRLGVAEHIKIVDSVNDINPYYSSAAFHVICSFEEGCPNAVCESMIHGLASIGYGDCEGTRQLIVHEKNGLLVERSEGETALASAICRFIEDEALRRSCATAAGEAAQSYFDPDRIYASWLDLLATIDAAQLKDGETAAPTENQLELAYFLGRFLSRYFDGQQAAGFAPTQAPTVDFIIPLYNKLDQIEGTIESILASRYPAYRIIVVDDQSTDGSYDFVRGKYGAHPKVKLVRREKNGGLSAARNTGLALSDARFIQFWDADDIYYGEALGRLVEAAVVGMSDIVTGIADRSHEILPAYRLSQANLFALKQPFCHLAFQTMSTCFKLYRRDFLMKHQLSFVEGLYMQDTELNLRAFAAADSVSMTDAIIGEYVDAGANRGSQHVSEARMRSALEIYQRASTVIDGRPRVPVEYSDFIVLKFVFRFFVVKLLPPEQFAENFDASVDRMHYLAQFRAYIRNMSPGIRRLFNSSEKNDWRWGVAFTLMQLDEDETALKILRLGSFRSSWAQAVAARVSGQIELDYALVLKRISMIGNSI